MKREERSVQGRIDRVARIIHRIVQKRKHSDVEVDPCVCPNDKYPLIKYPMSTSEYPSSNDA